MLNITVLIGNFCINGHICVGLPLGKSPRFHGQGDSWVGVAPAKSDPESEALLQRGSYAA